MANDNVVPIRLRPRALSSGESLRLAAQLLEQAAEAADQGDAAHAFQLTNMAGALVNGAAAALGFGGGTPEATR